LLRFTSSVLPATFCQQRLTYKLSPAMKLEKQLLQSLPKVLLHEHLDGVLRPRTVIELAKDGKYAACQPKIQMRFRSGFSAERIKGAWRNIWKALRIRLQ
jgi:hypothetical protein